MPSWKKVITSGSNASLNSLNVTSGVTITGSLNVTGSTTQIGTNTLLGNTTLSGSIVISGSVTTPSTPTIKIYGDMETDGVIKFMPVSKNIDTSISASYIYVSGSTQDLYFSQNGSGYNNVTRLRWLEGNLYTGLLHGGLITTQSSTVYQISSGSGIIVNLNASLVDDPYPTIQFLEWGNLSASIAPLTASYQQAFVGIDATKNIFAQGTPFSNGQFDSIINIGGVFFQNQSTINGIKTQPSVAYGFEQQQNTFNRAFGPLKLSGYTLAPSASSTGSLIVASGTAYAPGSNYIVDPNEPYYAVDNGTNVSKIFRYRQSGSTWVYDTNAGAGYTTINPGQYSNNGVLTTVQPNDWSIQRVFWFPNSVIKAIVVYYGNQSYSTKADAIANISIESFVEAPNTSANAIYLGAIIIRGNGVLTVPADFTIVPGGLFRQVGGSGGGGSIITQTLSGLSDVLISGLTDGQALVYDHTAAKWKNSSTLTANLTGNASTATSASYAATASYVQTAQTASYVLNAVSASFSTTASYAIQALSASYAPGGGAAFPYTGSAEITGSLGVTGSFGIQTYDGILANAYVPAIKISDGGRNIYDIFGTGSIDAGGRILIDNIGGPSLGWLSRTMFDSTPVQSIDWQNRIAYDASGTTYAIDWNNRIAIDGTGISSIVWGSRELNDSGGDAVITWDYLTQAQAVEINSYTRKTLTLGTVVESFSNLPVYASFKPDGEILNGVALDGSVANFDLVYLETDGKWYPVDVTDVGSSKLLGIAWNVGTGKETVFIEGTMVVALASSGATDAPLVDGIDHGLPIYIKTGGGIFMAAGPPVGAGNYVRVLGHAYYQGTAASDYWVMKFRPSNDWYVI